MNRQRQNREDSRLPEILTATEHQIIAYKALEDGKAGMKAEVTGGLDYFRFRWSGMKKQAVLQVILRLSSTVVRERRPGQITATETRHGRRVSSMLNQLGRQRVDVNSAFYDGMTLSTCNTEPVLRTHGRSPSVSYDSGRRLVVDVTWHQTLNLILFWATGMDALSREVTSVRLVVDRLRQSTKRIARNIYRTALRRVLVKSQRRVHHYHVDPGERTPIFIRVGVRRLLVASLMGRKTKLKLGIERNNELGTREDEQLNLAGLQGVGGRKQQPVERPTNVVVSTISDRRFHRWYGSGNVTASTTGSLWPGCSAALPWSFLQGAAAGARNVTLDRSAVNVKRFGSIDR